MTVLTLSLDDELAARLTERARAAGVSPGEFAGRVLGELLQHAPSARRLEFVGMSSSQELQSDRVDELLAQGYGTELSSSTPVSWSPRRTATTVITTRAPS